ncbi:MAG: NTP transferase domain-containing protein [Candidatus Hadarchaeota archaeon]|nr:NTP transferase domain-containing protein [Candidatus Hadarchaeota archaeon]
MEALILAAGMGERLNQITKGMPKALAPVAGVPLLCRILDSLKEAGVTSAHIVLGYGRREIIRQVGKKEYDGLPIHYIKNPDWEKGNLYSLLAAEGRFEGVFLLVMSDHLFDPRIVAHLASSKSEGALTLAVDRGEPSPEDTKVLEKSGKIRDIGKELKKHNCVDIGIFLCSPKIFRYAQKAAEDGNGELSDCIRYAALAGDARTFDITKISSYVSEMRRRVGISWIDVDTPEDLKRAKSSLVRSSGKGASDLLAHYVHRPIEDKLIYHLSDTRITPNHLTIATNLVAYSVTALFFFGHLLVASVLTFAVGLMDGLDGKLARVRGRSTKLGTLEHPFDLLFESSWLVALALFLSRSWGSLPLVLCALSIIFIAFYRHCYDQFRRAMDRSLDDYGGFERKFRRIAGRRNLYNIHILVWILIGAPFYSLVTILGHSIITAGVYAARAGMHMHAADKKLITPLGERGFLRRVLRVRRRRGCVYGEKSMPESSDGGRVSRKWENSKKIEF